MFDNDTKLDFSWNWKKNLNLFKLSSQTFFAKTKANTEVVELKNICIPKGLIHLEKLFAENDVAKDPKMKSDDEEVETYYLGTAKIPKNVKLSQFISLEDKQKYLDLMKKYVSIFAWSYVDLKSYHPNLIQHTIPIIKKWKVIEKDKSITFSIDWKGD